MERNPAMTAVTVALSWMLLTTLGLASNPDGIVFDPRCTPLPFIGQTPASHMAELSDGSLLMVSDNAVITTDDDGATWSPPRPIYDGPAPGIPSRACVLLKTQSGALVLVYMDMSTREWRWDNEKNEAAEARIDVWSIRSLDEGQTWIDRQQLLDGYCGALIDIVQTSQGRIVVPVQELLFRNRHAIGVRVSDDDGHTWQAGNIIDLGGRGHHDGAMEPTLTELSDGRMLMLIRTNFNRFWEAYSDDQGRYWRELRPSQVDASSAPGHMIRLASGRLALVWNRAYPEGQSVVTQQRRGGDDWQETTASWYRQEVSLAFSDDDAKTWSEPVVIARVPQRASYPYVFERRPGELWVFTLFQHRIGLSLKEADFVTE